MGEKEEEKIIIDDGLGIRELRQLAECQKLNNALNMDEFLIIMSAYLKCTNRILEQNIDRKED